MKKIFISFGILALGLGAFGVKANKPVRANADGEAAAVAALLTGAKDASSTYTKKTKIFLKTEAVQDIETHFHAGIPTLELTTYYNETAGALLMGDYDGGFDDFNSGYRNISETAVQHFSYKKTGEHPSTSELFTSRNDGWTAEGQTVGGYYQTLTSLSTVAGAAAWSSFTSNGYTTYKHVVSEAGLVVTNGAYADNVLNVFQYFAAPMLLRDNYISYNSIWVTEASSFLSIRLYASKSDSGKSTVTPGENDVLISEARVYKGLSFSPEAKWHCKGSFDSWGTGIEMEYVFDAYNPEQYKAEVALSFGNLVRFNNGGTVIGYDELENKTFFDRWNDGEYDNCLMAGLTGTYTFYLKPGLNSVYGEAPSDGYVDLALDLSNNWKEANAVFYAYAWGAGLTDKWFRANEAGTSVRITGLYTGMKLVRINPAHADNPGWGEGVKWAETGDLTINHLKT